MNLKLALARRTIIAALALALAGQACTLSLFQPPLNGGLTPPAVNIPPSPTPMVAAQTAFVVTLPEPLLPNEALAIAILDEVTGLSLNATQYPMTARDSLTYTATLPLPVHTIVKYRYVRRGAAQVLEDTHRSAPIRYRMYLVESPGEVQDIVADWEDKSYARPSGTILGQVTNADTGSPLPNILVNASGAQSITDSQGRFELPGLPAGTQNLVAYSMDGMYRAFQQGATVADNQTTVVNLRMKPLPLVNTTFFVTVPDTTVPGVPVRLAGNILQLGNTFADLQGGVSVSPDRMPVLRLQPDGRYALTLALPAGAHIQYKYTLGDGYWNAEHKADGAWNLRELIVPEAETVIQDVVLSWSSGDSPILFEVNVPPVTLPGDVVYIQFNTFGWMEPVPMWPLGRNRWAYKLYSPLNILGAFSYRYCRNGQCGSADDAQTAGPAPTGRQAATSVLGQNIQDTIGAWKWFENPEPVTLVGAAISARASGFMAGVEFQPAYRPNWSYYMPQAFLNTQAIGSNIVVLTPTWTCRAVSPLELAPVPGQDPLWIDSAIMVSQARAQGLNVALFPTLRFPDTAQTFWQNAPRNAQWWQEWFSRYRKFAVHYADLASQAGAQTLVLGGEWVISAMPGGVLPNGSPSNVPADSELQWKSVIAETRQHFKGQILWALPYTQAALQAPLNFLKDVDGIYLLWSPALSSNPSATKIDYANEAGRLLDNEVAPLASLLEKPVVLAVAYPSAAGAAMGCVPDGRSNCLDWNALSRPNPDVGAASLSLQTQADIYEATLIAVNLRPWVRGFVSRGYYPPAALQDKSMSAHSKPVADILWYWYPRLLGTIQ